MVAEAQTTQGPPVILFTFHILYYSKSALKKATKKEVAISKKRGDGRGKRRASAKKHKSSFPYTA